ncbi:hypothetical protein [Demequina lutea]|uniref:Dolichyl-phosphate-mannose-protein mannosyltransferase n=1 Tax=Demequina lutea TaxID=431489 RepID=A0A7Y9ZEF5_9MICO|nr:hypothetical protein [Demequina lutea]NYI41876.1 hypothetical protein [Demequina lutea]
MDERHTSRHLAVFILGIIVAGVLVAVFAPSITPGYDTSFALAWGRDLAHGYGLDFTHPSSPTPHPLALLAGLGAGFAPVHFAINAAGGLGVAAGLTTLALLGLVTFEVTASRIAVGAAVACTAGSAAVGLLVLGASADVAYSAIGLGAVLLTLRGRQTLAVAAFVGAALLRPEAVLFAVVPLALAFMAHRGADSRSANHHGPDQEGPAARPAWIRTAWMFAAGLALAVVAWLATGAAGGDPLVALHSASTNAQVNNNPRGPIVALTHALPGLAGPTGWLTVGAAATALVVAVLAGRSRARRALTPQARPGRSAPRKPSARNASARNASAHKTSVSRASARQVQAAPVARDAQQHATIITGIFVGVALIAYLAQGLTGTPLVARYLLLPALLCVALAARCIPLAARLARNPRLSTAVAAAVGVVLVGASAGSNVSAWHDVSYARQVRADAFTAASQLLDTDLARRCDAPVVVRSPAMVAMVALTLDRPLRDITVADQAGKGVLLQPLNNDAAQLAGYGPMTPLTQQATFPTDAPPRQSNADWALYSSCQP